MKSVFYAGAALMACAAIYGFVDFKKTSSRPGFETLYEERVSLQPASTPEDEKSESAVILPAAPEPVKEMKSTKTTSLKELDPPDLISNDEKELSPEFFSRAPLKETTLKEGIEKKRSRTKKSKDDQ